MVQWKISRESKIPLWIQVREQLRYVISSGAFEPGAKLPSIRELAFKTKVSVNTVVRAFQELEREGLIKSRVGDGSFVSTALYKRPVTGTAEQLKSLIRNLIVDAAQLGFSVSHCLDELQKVAQSHEEQPNLVAWVECNTFELNVFAQMIRDQSGVRVKPILLADLQANRHLLSNGSEPVAGVLTSVFHISEVTELLRGESLDVYSVFTNTSPENLAGIRKTSRGKKVVFVLRDQKHADVMINLVQEMCPHASSIKSCWLRDEAGFQDVLDTAEILIASGPVYAEILKLVRPEQKVFHLLDRVHPLSIQLIRQLYGAS